MSSLRGISVAVVIAAACVATAAGGLGAQTCSISSTARGPLSCSVATTVRMNVRIPSMVGVTMRSTGGPVAAAGPAVLAGLSVKTNRSYAVQLSRAPMDSADSIASASSRQSGVIWSTPTARAPLGEMPTQIDGLSGSTSGPNAIQVAFARDSQPDGAPLNPIRLLLTVVAP